MTLATSSTALARDSVPSRFDLDWVAPQDCLDRDAARKAIEDALGPASARAKTRAVVRVNIAETGAGRFAADIWMYDDAGGGERSFEGTSCIQVAQAAALIVALALEASRDAGPPSTPAALASEHTAPLARQDAGDRTRFGVGVRAGGDIGSLPAADAGMALVLELHYRRIRLEGEGSAWLPRTAYAGPAAGSGGQFSLYTGGLRVCFDLLPRGPAWSLGPCAGAEGGVTIGSGVGLATRRSTNVIWGAGLLGLSLRFLGAAPFGVGLLAELGAPLHRAAWQIDDFGSVFQPSPLIGRAALGLTYLFP